MPNRFPPLAAPEPFAFRSQAQPRAMRAPNLPSLPWTELLLMVVLLPLALWL